MGYTTYDGDLWKIKVVNNLVNVYGGGVIYEEEAGY